ncbi:velvet factor-domain-containing protein [Trametes elegans]|nr:velvet factor-domain-containing protein [Trametes elegans]
MEDEQHQFVHAKLPVHSQYDRDRLEYELTMRQEPKQARMCGVGADRRPIDPPPIVQLRVIDPSMRRPQSSSSRASSPDSAAPPSAQSFLQNPYYFMFASLAKPDEDVELHWLKVRLTNHPPL